MNLIKFRMNGQKYYVKKKISLFDLMTYFNYNHAILVLEYNNQTCNKKDWKDIFISETDKIEIITIVGGG